MLLFAVSLILALRQPALAHASASLSSRRSLYKYSGPGCLIFFFTGMRIVQHEPDDDDDDSSTRCASVSSVSVSECACVRVCLCVCVYTHV